MVLQIYIRFFKNIIVYYCCNISAEVAQSSLNIDDTVLWEVFSHKTVSSIFNTKKMVNEDWAIFFSLPSLSHKWKVTVLCLHYSYSLGENVEKLHSFHLFRLLQQGPSTLLLRIRITLISPVFQMLEGINIWLWFHPELLHFETDSNERVSLNTLSFISSRVEFQSFLNFLTHLPNQHFLQLAHHFHL